MSKVLLSFILLFSLLDSFGTEGKLPLDAKKSVIRRLCVFEQVQSLIGNPDSYSGKQKTMALKENIEELDQQIAENKVTLANLTRFKKDAKRLAKEYI